MGLGFFRVSGNRFYFLGGYDFLEGGVFTLATALSYWHALVGIGLACQDPSSPLLPSWVSRFDSPQPGQPPVVVEDARGTFTLDSGVTRVSTSLFLNLNVEHMENRVLIGKLVGKHIEARTIKWKLGLTWGLGVKNPFYLNHFGHHWYVVEFMEQEEMEYVLDNRPWFLVEYRDAEILEVILQLVDLRLPLKRVMVINDQEDCLVLLSYKKLFEVCFYCGQRKVEGHKCLALEDKDGWLLVDRVF
ncbi:hypothetical protein D8674_026308 [Pyrus ussuriensis x Pyrus communis]|uniref:DUF4283 domain-containing protein n=1 Tax=Pyrus ussuriensis x Pyrus communis TaxID=2448454 RepID=A0A5N5IL00_9ROSA|nr:hypothetical protein D8674_026308 [Pyrus ussuriensis x Pyrus communis]